MLDNILVVGGGMEDKMFNLSHNEKGQNNLLILLEWSDSGSNFHCVQIQNDDDDYYCYYYCCCCCCCCSSSEWLMSQVAHVGW